MNSTKLHALLSHQKRTNELQSAKSIEVALELLGEDLRIPFRLFIIGYTTKEISTMLCADLKVIERKISIAQRIFYIILQEYFQ